MSNLEELALGIIIGTLVYFAIKTLVRIAQLLLESGE